MKPSKEHARPKRVYFLFPVYLIGGGEIFACRVIEYLYAHTDIKAGIIDFTDGTLSRTCRKFFADEDIDYIDYESAVWNLENDSVIFAGADHLGAVKPLRGENVRICVIDWELLTGWDILFEKRTKTKVAELLKKTNGICFMDAGCYMAGCDQLKQKFSENYMPLYFYTPGRKTYEKETPENEINLVWLGRFAGSKEMSVYNIIQNFAKYKTDKKKVFHLIGNGPSEQNIRSFARRYDKEIRFVFPGILIGDEQVRYLMKNADIGVAMGTSVLNIAALGIPVIVSHQYETPFFQDQFLYLPDIYGYCLATLIKNEKPYPANYGKFTSFNQMLDDVSKNGKRKEIGEKCRQFYLENFSSFEKFGQSFVNVVSKTTLTYEMLKKTLRYLPYNDTHGLAVQTFCFKGIPFLKIRHHGNKIRFFLFGLEVAKVVRTDSEETISVLKIFKIVNRGTVYLFNIKIFKSFWWGRYSYWQAVNPQVKEECKDKYAITEKILPPKNSARKRIYIDLDGTLTDPSERTYRLFKELNPQTNLSADEYKALKRSGVSNEELLNSDETQTASFREKWLEKIEEKDRIETDTAFEGADVFLKRISETCDVYLVTCRRKKDLVLYQIEKFGWNAFFTDILTTEGKMPKEELIRRSVFPAAQDVLIGDTAEDIECAKKLGIRSVCVCWGARDKKLLLNCRPDFIAESFDDVKNCPFL